MSVATFIPEVWSARLQENLRKNLVFGSLCNRAWEGEISAYGDTVHINALTDITVKPYDPTQDLDAPEALTTTDRALVINHGAYCNFCLNDVDAAQARADIMDAAMRSAAIRLAEDVEGYVIDTITAQATHKETVTPGEGDTLFDLLTHIKTRMDGWLAPRHGRALVMSSAKEAELFRDSRLTHAGSAVGDAALVEGVIARACGFDIYVSHDLDDSTLVALTPDAVTLAQQIVKLEAYRREKGFDDCVKGLSVCGAKVVQPDCLGVFTVS
jgi:hypothetical protein